MSKINGGGVWESNPPVLTQSQDTLVLKTRRVTRPQAPPGSMTRKPRQIEAPFVSSSGRSSNQSRQFRGLPGYCPEFFRPGIETSSVEMARLVRLRVREMR